MRITKIPLYFHHQITHSKSGHKLLDITLGLGYNKPMPVARTTLALSDEPIPEDLKACIYDIDAPSRVDLLHKLMNHYLMVFAYYFAMSDKEAGQAISPEETSETIKGIKAELIKEWENERG